MVNTKKETVQKVYIYSYVICPQSGNDQRADDCRDCQYCKGFHPLKGEVECTYQTE